ncbi:MAG: hypothetical protein CSA58_11710 [Micrococcales bacterium]|nr:MAG: hypothetical protein CSA58_11710 [Micrococcales bacterium]
MSLDGRALRVLVVDDHDVVRVGLRTLSTVAPQVVGSVQTAEHPDRIDLAGEPPDVTVMDFWFGDEVGPTAQQMARLRSWPTRVLLYTNESRPAALRESIIAGVSGLCLKTDGLDALAHAIRDVAGRGVAASSEMARTMLCECRDHDWLTPRERDVLRCLCDGLTDAQIAEILVISVKTVDNHVQNIFRKFRDRSCSDSVNRALAVRIALETGEVCVRGSTLERV